MSAAQEHNLNYCREIALRLRNTVWEQRFLLSSVALGQFLSLCVCATGVTSELLEKKYSITVPTTQAFFNYLLLALTFGVYLATKKRFLNILKYNWWKYLILGAVDVEANYLLILAYKYTNLTSIQLLDCFTIACVMLLSYVFLKTRYKLINIMGVLLTIIGIGSLVIADLQGSRNGGGSSKFLGDMLCLVGAGLYAALNVTQEYLVKSHSIVEYLGLIGIVGTFVSAAQLIGLERMNIARIQWSPSVGGLFSGFGFSLFLFYSVTPLVIRMSSAVVFNLSLLTADFYSLLFGLYLFKYTFSGFYVLGFCLVVVGIFIYSLKHPVEKKLRQRSAEERQRQSIERQYSVAPTKIDSDSDTQSAHWEIRGLLESSTDTLLSSHSHKGTGSLYGSTELKTPVAKNGQFVSTLQKHARCSPTNQFLLPYKSEKKDRYTNGRGWGPPLVKRNGGTQTFAKEEEKEEGGVTFTRIGDLGIDRGDSVKFSQSAPLIVIEKPFFGDGGTEQTRLVKKEAEEERRKEEVEEEEEGEKEVEEEEEKEEEEKREDLLSGCNNLLQQSSKDRIEVLGVKGGISEGGGGGDGGGGEREMVKEEEGEKEEDKMPSLVSKKRTSPFLESEEEEEESGGEKGCPWLAAGPRLRSLSEELDYKLLHNNLEEGGGRKREDEGGGGETN